MEERHRSERGKEEVKYGTEVEEKKKQEINKRKDVEVEEGWRKTEEKVGNRKEDAGRDGGGEEKRRKWRWRDKGS